MRHLSKLLVLVTVVFGLAFSATYIAQPPNKVLAVADILEEPILVYGGNLNENQREEVRRLLNVDTEEIAEMSVTGADIAHYIDGNPNSKMYSSVKITSKDSGHGIVVNIITADNITQVTSEMYSNALLTAGVENALIEVVSPVQVTGHSALTGIYKAYDEGGAELDQDRMEVANEELSLSTKLTSEGISEEKVSELLAEIKKEIANQDPATREDVERIVAEQLDQLEISLSEADRQLLIDLFDKMRNLDIDFDKVKEQLEDITNTIKDRLGDINIDIDEGFWKKVMNFFRDIFDSIASMFTSEE